MNKASLLILTIALTNHYTHAELLIIKKGPEGLMSLDEYDKSNESMLAATLLNYEWPAVIANTQLASKEQDELLNPNKPYAEENFIREKIKKINPDYDVVFIPTSLYEIFVMSQCKNSEFEFLKQADDETASVWTLSKENSIVKAINKSAENRNAALNDIYAPYKKANAEFYKEAFFYINNALAAELFNMSPELKKLENGHTVSAKIQDAIYLITADLIKKGLPALQRCGGITAYVAVDIKKDSDTINIEGPLARSIALEYEARKLNEGLLFRGTSLIEQKFGQERVVTLAGGTVTEANLPSLAKAYKEKNNNAYSISFGNSLFAGARHDKTATVYYYLVHSMMSTPGYALLINKKAYIQNNCDHLFFIPPLMPLAALFAEGELFHARSKAAFAKKEKGVAYTASGLNPITVGRLIDPFGMLIIQRDPLYHAELFSNFLAHNMRVIKKEGFVETEFSDKERDALEAQLKIAQKEAAEYYKAIRVLEPWAIKSSKKFKKKREKKNATAKEASESKKS